MSLKNREERKAYQRQWYEANLELVKARGVSYYERNRERVKAYQKVYNKTNPEKAKNRYLRSSYGLTVAAKEIMSAAQEHRCANPGCRNLRGEGRRGALVVDHCHVTGSVRGLLCHNCNLTLGLVHENITRLEGLVAYLLHHSNSEE